MALTDAQKEKLIKLGQLGKFKELADAKYQDKINDLATIRSGAEAGATAYQKPSTGIPSTDLAEAVQALLTAAGTALQASDLNTLNGKVAALEAYFSSEEDSDTIINKWNEIVAFLTGIAESQTLDGIISGINDSIAAKYTKPSGGIPKTDLAEAVQTSLGKADTALQNHQDISGKADKDTDAVENNFAMFDANGNPVDSGHKHSDYQAAGNYKTTQSAVDSPSADGTGIEFIDSVSQNANGVISPHKKTIQSASASQAGVMSAAHYSKVEAISYADDTDIAALFS